MNSAYPHFTLTLMVNHACNLRCSYCYTGAKFSAPMPFQTGMVCIERALRSLAAAGRLQLGFFGGEPLLEASSIANWIQSARACAEKAGKRVTFNLTTNGTITSGQAWEVMMQSDLELAVSFDGTPELHDRHRYDAHGRGSGQSVEATVRRLVQSDKPFIVVMVVRPDNLQEVPCALEHLQSLGVSQVQLSLDLWTGWTAKDGQQLEQCVAQCARLWRQWLPHFSLNWFDSKTAALAGLAQSEKVIHCGFGQGEIAVAPSGRLYPCERLIGEDRPDHPLRLPGHALEGEDFLAVYSTGFERSDPCTRCQLAAACDTFCHCSNFVRTGDVNRPDGLLCLLNKAAARATVEVLGPAAAKRAHTQNQERCYAS